MKAFITGIAGFVGAGLARSLLEDGVEVSGLVRAHSDIWRLEEIKSRLNLHVGDLLDKKTVFEAIGSAKPTVVFHLGSYGAYPRKQSDPEKIFETSLQGTLHVLLAAKKAGVGMVVNTGSSSEYGTKDHPMEEGDILAPNSYYAVGKAAQTHLCQHFARAEDLPVVTLRLFSVYGPFEESSRLVPTAIAHALAGRDVPIAHPDIAHDFIYLSDVVEAYKRAGNMPELGREVINIGTGVQRTLRDIYESVVRETGSSSKMKVDAYEKQVFDTNMWVADISKMKSKLGLTPKYSLEDGMRETVKWFSSYAHIYKK